MKLILNTPLQSLNKTFRKEKVKRDDFDNFKSELKKLISRINEKETEEHLKTPLRDFLKTTFFRQHEINTKGRTDLGIFLSETDKSKLGVIIETKKPGSPEMPTKEDINKKALHEAVLYYLRERNEESNNDLNNIIITNLYEWFIFDAHTFERFFYKSTLNKEYIKWKAGQKTSSNTDLFYKEIAYPFIASLNKEISCVYFDVRDYHAALDSDKPSDEKKLTALYKILSDVNLLKKTFANDSNSLDRKFYNELLHIIGLEETKQGSKKVIGRKEKPDNGSLIENTMATIETNEKLNKVAGHRIYGETKEERLFSVALELVITWINRILFLKLLEAQLIRYHQGDKSYKFLDVNFIADYDELHELFFEVLAKTGNERKPYIKDKFSKIPYLNSSLFELTENSLEDLTIVVSNLKDRFKLPIYPQTVLKENGKKRTGELSTLTYLFEFLDAYDFSSEGGEEIQEENKALINASVLGLIFEKINGYKDGSFFTPGFITMYMCRESIRRAVLQKFKDAKGWECENIEKLKGKIEDLKEANEIINSLKICDPAVGSGHFLVSALNEIIALKSELGILCYRNGNPVRNYKVEITNDELTITDKYTDEIFEYRLNEKGNPIDYLQELQEALFHEKETIIENCLFGVDINSNSVNICRLRLWIELLKNAYYTSKSKYTSLETLPNIDINIKCGNSLISRYSVNDIVFKRIPNYIKKLNDYKFWVNEYKKTNNKELKKQLASNIKVFINDFKLRDPRVIPLEKKLAKKTEEYIDKFDTKTLFEVKKTKEFEKTRIKLETEIKELTQQLEELRSNKLYENAFEWRFEFPEVLDEEGQFIGFDVIIGNPPYYQIQKLNKEFSGIKNSYLTYEQTGDIYILFYEKGWQILQSNGSLNFITSNKWLRANYGSSFRKFLINKTECQVLIDFNYYQVFDEASVDTNILMFTKGASNSIPKAVLINEGFNISEIDGYLQNNFVALTNLSEKYWNIISEENSSLNSKLKNKGKKIKDWGLSINYGIKTGLNEAFIISEETKNELLAKDLKNKEIIVPFLRGRDICRFGYKHENLWLINTHNGIKTKGIKPISVEKNYPTIFQYLNKFELKAQNRSDKGDHWTNLRNCAYLEDFEKEKIVYAETMRIHKSDTANFPRFGYDNKGFFCDKTTFIATGQNIKFLMGVLNSKLGAYLVKEYITKLDTGGYMMQKVFLEEIPVVLPPEDEKITSKVQEIIDIKNQDIDTNTTKLEDEIDQLVYQLYNLTEEEIKIIESA